LESLGGGDNFLLRFAAVWVLQMGSSRSASLQDRLVDMLSAPVKRNCSSATVPNSTVGWVEVVCGERKRKGASAWAADQRGLAL